MTNGGGAPRVGAPSSADSAKLAVWEWLHDGMWRTAILHGLLTFLALSLTPSEFFDGAALGWFGAWLYRSIGDTISVWVMGELDRQKVLAEILDVAVPIVAIILAVGWRAVL